MPFTDVHVIGDNTALYTTLGAIAGVIVGAGGSMYQQHRKIAEDRVQLKKRLKAEHKRLDLQLKYDRGARELDALRRVLDDGSVLLEETRSTLREIARTGLWFEDPDEADDEDEAAMKARDTRFRAKHAENVTQAQAVDSRIKLWLSATDAIHEAFRMCIDTFNEAIQLMEKEKYQELLDGDNDLAAKIEHFQDEARKRVGLLSLTPASAT